MVNTCSLFLDKRAYSGGDVYLGNCANHVFCHYYLSSRHVTLNALHHLISFSFFLYSSKRFFSLLYFFTLHSVPFSFYLLAFISLTLAVSNICNFIMNPSSS